MNTPQRYEIRVRGHISSTWATWFEHLAIYHEPNGDTRLVGALPDQAALHGILMRIRDLGLLLLAVNRVDSLDTHTD